MGNVVLLKEKLPRGQWRVGRIIELIKGRDQLVRSAKVRMTLKKVLTRALNMLYPIECPDHEMLTDANTVDVPSDDTKKTEENSGGYESSGDNRRTRPTRKAVVAAREKIKRWLNPDDELVGPGSVADHAS